MLNFNDCIIQINNKNILKINGTVCSNKYVITGKNGQGKTTFLRLLNKELNYTGNVIINNKELKEVNHNEMYNNYLTYMPQDVILSPYVTFDVLIHDLDIILTKQQIEFVESLSVKRNVKINTMSNGQKQKVALLVALFRDTKIILLDEPFNNMDQKSIKEAIKYFETIENKIFIIITHSNIMDLQEQNFIHLNITNNELDFLETNELELIGQSYTKSKNNNFLKHIKNSLLFYLASITVLYFLVYTFCKTANVDIIQTGNINTYIQTNRENILLTIVVIIITILVNIYLLNGLIKNNKEVVNYFKFNNLYYSFRLIYIINIIIFIVLVGLIISGM